MKLEKGTKRPKYETKHYIWGISVILDRIDMCIFYQYLIKIQ